MNAATGYFGKGRHDGVECFPVIVAAPSAIGPMAQQPLHAGRHWKFDAFTETALRWIVLLQ